jgi:hypothetical protein
MERVLSYQAGAASVCITPQEPLWLAGYASRTAPARGTISDLFASALAIEDRTGQRFIIASIEVIAVTPAITDVVVEHLQSKHGLSRRQLLLAATHTHYAPEFRIDKQVFFNIPPDFAAKLASTAKTLASAICVAIDRALERLEPAQLYVRQTHVGFAHNRRRHGVKGGAPSSEDIVDHDAPILECVNLRGERKAIVFGYACHNTTIPPEYLRYCGDWAGFAKKHLEESNPSTVAMFLPGAGADQEPEPTGSIELSRQHGQELAAAVSGALSKPGIEISGTIRVEMEDVSLPLQPVTRQLLQRMLTSDDRPQQKKARFLLDALERGEELMMSYRAPVQVLRLGDQLLLFALSGEPVVDWSIKLKSELADAGDDVAKSGSAANSPARPVVWVAGYCHDMFGYLPTRRVQREGGYEGGRANLWSSIPAPFTEEVEDLITDAVRRLVQRTAAHGPTQDSTDVC